MKLFVANTSHQPYQFTFRVPESNKRLDRSVARGTQVLAFEGTSSEVEGIISQHSVYGLLEAREAKRRHKNYHGICYSIDVPVKIEQFNDIHDANYEALEDRGKAIRRQAGMHTAHDIRNAVSQASETGLSVSVGDTSMEFQDENEAGGPQEFNERIQYQDRPGEQRSAPRGRRGRRS